MSYCYGSNYCSADWGKFGLLPILLCYKFVRAGLKGDADLSFVAAKPVEDFNFGLYFAAVKGLLLTTPLPT